MSDMPRWDWTSVNDKVRRRILQSGERTMMLEVEFAAGADTPVHKHPHEQMSYVARGEAIFTIDGIERRIPAGESVFLASNVPHGARADVPTTLIDVFSPPREEFLAVDRRLDPPPATGNG